MRSMHGRLPIAIDRRKRLGIRARLFCAAGGVCSRNALLGDDKNAPGDSGLQRATCAQGVVGESGAGDQPLLRQGSRLSRQKSW